MEELISHMQCILCMAKLSTRLSPTDEIKDRLRTKKPIPNAIRQMLLVLNVSGIVQLLGIGSEIRFGIAAIQSHPSKALDSIQTLNFRVLRSSIANLVAQQIPQRLKEIAHSICTLNSHTPPTPFLISNSQLFRSRLA